MGYRHWRLGMGDAYQLGVARARVLAILYAHSTGGEGPVALACEAPVDGWDDIVEFGAAARAITATHYQVKLQNTNFKKSEKHETFEALFNHAAILLREPSPYEEVVVASADRRFRLVFPTGDITVGSKLGVDQLRMLLQECEGNAADRIVANEGVKLIGKDDGDQKREWLSLIRSATGSDDACANLLRQMRVDLHPEATLEHDPRLSLLFDDPARARDIVDKALRSVAPEGYMDVDELLPLLTTAQPRAETRQVRIAQHGDRFHVQPKTRTREVRIIADTIVASVWADQGAADLHIGFPLPESSASLDARALRLACIRLLLHAQRSPTFVSGNERWYERGRREVQRALGLITSSARLDAAHFTDRAAPMGLPPKACWPPDELANALHAAMDAHLWKLVCRHGASMLAGANGVPFDHTVGFLTSLGGFFERVLHGWWGLEKTASGVARAGPVIAGNVACIAAGLAVLQHAGYAISAPVDSADVATIGELPVRALAIEQAATTCDDEPQAANLCEHASNVVVHAGIALVAKGDVGDYYALATLRPIDDVTEGAGLQDESPAAFLMSSEALVAAAKKGAQRASELIQRWCDDRARHHRAALDAALRQWSESNAA